MSLGNHPNVLGGLSGGGSGGSGGRTFPTVETLTDATPVTINTDTSDGGTLASLSQATTFNAPTAVSPHNMQRYTLRIKSASPQTLTFTTGANAFRSSADLAFPATTSGSSKTDYLVFQYNSADTRWDFVGRNLGF